MGFLSIFCFPLTFSILWSELWYAKTVTCYQYSLKISWLFSYWFRSYKGFAFHSPTRRRCIRLQSHTHKTSRRFVIMSYHNNTRGAPWSKLVPFVYPCRLRFRLVLPTRFPCQSLGMRVGRIDERNEFLPSPKQSLRAFLVGASSTCLGGGEKKRRKEGWKIHMDAKWKVMRSQKNIAPPVQPYWLTEISNQSHFE